MKLLAAFALALVAAACTDTTTVYGAWSDESVAGGCHPFLWDSAARIAISDTQGQIVSEEFDCDELGFSLEIPIDVTHIRVTGSDPQGGHFEQDHDVVDGYVDVGHVRFWQDSQPD